MKAAIEPIDPAFAKQALSQAIVNRSLNMKRVRQYARDMKTGRWQANGETIKFSPTGKLIDGQHRMAAIIESQETISMLVARNVSEGAFATIDSGKSRSVNDTLSIQGYKNTSTTASAARIAYGYISSVSIGYAFTRPELLEFIEQHPWISEVSSKVDNHLRKMAKGPIAAVLYLGTHSGLYEDELKSFLEGLQTGAGMWKGDPRLTFREWYLARAGGLRVMSAEAVFASTARAWNAHAEGRELLKLSQAKGFTRKTMPIVGFDRTKFPDIKDIAEAASKSRATNLGKTAKEPLILPKKHEQVVSL